MNIISGTKRSIYPQTGFNFQFDVVMDNYTGSLNCGFSGINGNTVNFSFNSGRIIDNNGNYFSNYQINTITSLSGSIIGESYDYFLNGNPIAYNQPKNFDYYDYVYINNTNCQPNVSPYIYGEQPYIFFNNVNGNTGQPLTGYFNISGFNLNVYSGYSVNTVLFQPVSFPTGIISGGNSFILDTANINETGKYIINIGMSTNAGYISDKFEAILH